VNCQDDGIGLIVAHLDSLRATRPIRCHLARQFTGSYGVHLTAGGPPAPFTVTALDAQGRLIPEPQFRLILTDTTTIALRDGLVFGLRPGVAAIRIRSSGREGGHVYFVEPAVTGDSRVRSSGTRPVP
jgi:hypothetical protein